MKMLVATTISEYKFKLEEFFANQNIPFYNEFELKSVDKSGKPEHRVGNWFAQGKNPYNHMAFFAIIEDEQADNLLIDLSQCKKEMPDCKMHAYIINIEKGL